MSDHKYGVWNMDSCDPKKHHTTLYLVEWLGHAWWITHSKSKNDISWLQWANKRNVGLIGKRFDAHNPEFKFLTKEDYFAEIL